MRKYLATIALVMVAISASYSQSAKVVSAFNYLKSGDFDLAKTAINEATQDPKTGVQAKTWYYRGAIYQAIYGDSAYHKKNPDALIEAVKSYEKAMELDPKNQWKDEIKLGLSDCANYAYNEAVAPFNRKDYQSAYDHFALAANTYEFLNKTYNMGLIDTFATLYAGNSALKMKNYDAAQAMYQKLLDKNISLPELYASMGDLYMQKGDTAKAKEMIGQGVKMYPNDKQLMVQELNLYLFSGDKKEAIRKLDEAIAKDPGFTELYIQRGNLYDDLGDTTNARKSYEEAIAKDPNNFNAFYRLGASYYNRAVDLNNQMNKLDLNQQKVYDQLKGQRDSYFKQALPYLEKAYKLDPKDEDTLGALKELYARLGQMDKSNQMKKELEQLKGQ
ncbi:MAG: tetratricopeptide repeat protein [Bacteroidetes bacterium]|nr:tetratricopeptide repeat protein [Bacteroidota bacterium]